MVLFVETVGVVGAGTMGAQIAEIFALNGKRVILSDVEDRFVQSGMNRIRKSLEGLAAFHAAKAETEIRGAESKLGITLTPEQRETAQKKIRPTFTSARVQQTLELIEPTTRLEDHGKAEFVVEAILEDLEAKSKLFQSLHKICGPRTVFATNTSALPITPLAKASGRPSRFIGTHFFNPPTTLPLVEIIRGAETADETQEDTINLLSAMRNHRYPLLAIPVKECPGFLVNRILGQMLDEAYRCLEEGVASARDIDAAMKAGAGFPMGPLELSDLIGLDVIQHARRNVETLGKDYPRVDRPKVLDRLVAEGRLGRKSGKGFFEY